MASVLNPSIMKQPLKVIDVPLNKFSEEVVPHHQNAYEKYKATIQKLITVNNTDQLRREIKDKKRTIKQLRDLMYELDTLRTQVEDTDLDQFDIKTLSLRKIIIALINGYTEMERAAEKTIKSTEFQADSEKENCNPFDGAAQIQMEANIEELKLKQHYDQLNRVENINKDVEDLHDMYKSLNQMVDIQGGDVDHIQETVEHTQQNVNAGAGELVKAHKLKAVAYPVTGAFLGGMIGGPIGLVAGLKVGGFAALGCAIAGYTGGKFFNKMNDPDYVEPLATTTVVGPDSGDATEKKEI